jgi:hypothetical protein
MTKTTNPLADEPAPQAETEAERAARLARESTLLDEARQDVRAGRVLADEDVDAWLDRLVRGESLPLADALSSRRAG